LQIKDVVDILKEISPTNNNVSENDIEVFKEDVRLFYDNEVPQELLSLYNEMSHYSNPSFYIYSIDEIIDKTEEWIEIISDYYNEEIPSDFICFGEENGDQLIIYSFSLEQYGITDREMLATENYLYSATTSLVDLFKNSIYKFPYVAEKSLDLKEIEEN
jgi:hypothetical protein